MSCRYLYFPLVFPKKKIKGGILFLVSSLIFLFLYVPPHLTTNLQKIAVICNKKPGQSDGIIQTVTNFDGFPCDSIPVLDSSMIDLKNICP